VFRSLAGVLSESLTLAVHISRRSTALGPNKPFLDWRFVTCDCVRGRAENARYANRETAPCFLSSWRQCAGLLHPSRSVISARQEGAVSALLDVSWSPTFNCLWFVHCAIAAVNVNFAVNTIGKLLDLMVEGP
jgi:hypothetical protein